MAGKEMVKVYELLLNGPGMGTEFKLSFAVSKRQLLLICLLVEQGMYPGKERAEELAALLTKERVAELAGLLPEMLKKGGGDLLDFYEKLKLL